MTDLLLSTAYNLHILFNVFLFFPFCLFFKYRNIPLSMLKLVMSVEVSSSSDDKPSLCSALFPFCSLACRRRVLHPSTNTKEAKLKTWAEIAFYQLGTKVTLSWSKLKIWCTENLCFTIYSWIHIIRFCESMHNKLQLVLHLWPEV